MPHRVRSDRQSEGSRGPRRSAAPGSATSGNGGEASGAGEGCRARGQAEGAGREGRLRRGQGQGSRRDHRRGGGCSRGCGPRKAREALDGGRARRIFGSAPRCVGQLGRDDPGERDGRGVRHQGPPQAHPRQARALSQRTQPDALRAPALRQVPEVRGQARGDREEPRNPAGVRGVVQGVRPASQARRRAGGRAIRGIRAGRQATVPHGRLQRVESVGV